jgi:hypothetical protein
VRPAAGVLHAEAERAVAPLAGAEDEDRRGRVSVRWPSGSSGAADPGT